MEGCVLAMLEARKYVDSRGAHLHVALASTEVWCALHITHM
jgi:hypothetical protein